MKNQFYPNLFKGFIVSLVFCSLFVKARGQTSSPSAAIINNSGTTQISCAVPSINVTATGGISYSWSNGLGTDANAIITTAGTYTTTVRDANGNSTAASITITEHPNGPPAPTEIDGPTNVCNYIGTADLLVYTATAVAGATGYEWTIPPAVNIVSGQGSNVLTVTINPGFATSVNKQLRIRTIADCGVSEYAIKYLAVQAPGSIQAVNGPTDVCPYLGNATEAIYSIAGTTGVGSYQWTVPAGATITENNGMNIKVIFDNNFVTGPVSVYAINNCGVSNTRAITVKRTLPSKPGMISGIANGCLFLPSAAHLAGSPATYSVVKAAGVTYNWTVPPGVFITAQGTGATTDFIKVNFIDGYEGGDITVSAVNGCGTSAARTFTLVAYSPGTPSLITSEFIQACPERLYKYSIVGIPSNAVSAQWSVPATGTIINGQGTSSVIVSYPGYTTGVVSVTGNNGCGDGATRSLNVTIPQCQPERNAGRNAGDNIAAGRANLVSQNKSIEVNVFPNPTTTDFKLQVLTAGRGPVYVKLMDAQGRLFKMFEIMPYQSISFGTELKAGIYLMEVTKEDKIKTTRLIKF